jgi:hypothetical protein
MPEYVSLMISFQDHFGMHRSNDIYIVVMYLLERTWRFVRATYIDLVYAASVYLVASLTLRG